MRYGLQITKKFKTFSHLKVANKTVNLLKFSVRTKMLFVSLSNQLTVKYDHIELSA